MSAAEFEQVLRDLKAGALSAEAIGPAIVKLGKPFDDRRIAAAKDVVASYLHHYDGWVRHEALWFLCSLGRLLEYKSAAIDALLHDSEADNRGFAALCLEQMLRGSQDPMVITQLANVVDNPHEERLTRLNAYGALLEVARGESGWDFHIYAKGLDDVEWPWVRSLTSRE